MTWSEQSVLVTGAGGFIGSHLVEALVERGARVRAFVRYNSRGDVGLLNFLSPDVRKRLVIVPGDLRDPAGVLSAMDGCTCVFHLGALISIPYSYRHPFEVIETNIVGTVNVLEAARHARPERVIHTSTSEVYGTAQIVPIDERHPLQGQSPYSASKIGADKIAESYYRAFDVPVATVRPFNTYGPRQSGRAVIPTIICQALSGNVVQLGSLQPTRDFTYVSDTVQGFLRAAEAGAIVGQEVNLGSNQETSVAELVSMIGALLNRSIEVESSHERVRPAKSEVERLRASNVRAKELLGWEPTVSLKDGLGRTIDWIAGHTELYRPWHYEV